MFSKLKTLLVAGGAILPLASGFAFAQTTQPTTQTANPPSVAAPALAPSAVTGSPVIGKNVGDTGAVKAGSTDTKIKQDKATEAKPAVKTAALATKHHSVKKHHAVQKTDTAATGKTTAPAANPTTKSGDSVPAKKL